MEQENYSDQMGTAPIAKLLLKLFAATIAGTEKISVHITFVGSVPPSRTIGNCYGVISAKKHSLFKPTR